MNRQIACLIEDVDIYTYIWIGRYIHTHIGKAEVLADVSSTPTMQIV